LNTELGRIKITRKTGSEKFHYERKELETELIEFWQWSTSDLVSNVSRGVLAEFVVAKALDIDTVSNVRDEWAAYDLETPDGIKVEVKSAAYVQSWYQNKLSTISFRTPKTLVWDPDTNTRNSEPSRVANIYVFALLSHKDKKSIDPMNLNQWSFYVLPTTILDERTRSQHSITLPTLERLSGGSVTFYDLKEKVSSAFESRNGLAR
jgi:hypothetical protein